MPLAAVLLVLLSIVTLLAYVLLASRSRLEGYVKGQALVQAATLAEAVGSSPASDLQSQLEPAADTQGGEVLVVDRQSQIVAQAGDDLLSPVPDDVLQRAAAGDRSNELIQEHRVAVVPVVSGGNLEGGLIFVPGESENTIYQLLVRSGIEAGAAASVLGGGLALLLAALLSRRVERIVLGAQAIGSGQLSKRIEPSFKDELGELAEEFNAMAQKLEDSFRQLEEHDVTLDAILNNLAEGVLATDLKGKVLFINHAARVMLGLPSSSEEEPPPEELPSPWKDFDLPQAIARCAKEQECIEARTQDGESFLRVNLEHLAEFDDHKGGVLVVIQDLSEGRRLEANQQRFLANAAHELKTPITTIIGASELLLTESEDKPEIRQRFLEHIHAEARRMQRLSETLLRLARTGSDLRDPEIELLDLDGIARESAQRMEPLAQSAGLKIRAQGEGGRVRADHQWLEQALLAVLGNAVQHSEPGGEVRVHVEGGSVSVEDEGRGISQEELPYVFERFYRGKKNTGGGFGLGLAICKDLIERMDGSISLESEEGVGTKVKIQLPEV